MFGVDVKYYALSSVHLLMRVSGVGIDLLALIRQHKGVLIIYVKGAGKMCGGGRLVTFRLIGRGVMSIFSQRGGGVM